MDVIARIQELREERGWTNYQLAKKSRFVSIYDDQCDESWQ